MKNIENHQKDLERLAGESELLSREFRQFADDVRQGHLHRPDDCHPLFDRAEEWFAGYARLVHEITGQTGEFNEVSFTSLANILEEAARRQTTDQSEAWKSILEWCRTLESRDESLKDIMANVRREAVELLPLPELPRSESSDDLSRQVRPFVAAFFLLTDRDGALSQESSTVYFEELTRRFGNAFAFASLRRALEYAEPPDLNALPGEPFRLVFAADVEAKPVEPTSKVTTTEEVVHTVEPEPSVDAAPPSTDREERPETPPHGSATPSDRSKRIHPALDKIDLLGNRVHRRNPALWLSDPDRDEATLDEIVDGLVEEPATEILENPILESAEEANTLLWKLLMAGRYSLALHLCRFLEDRGVTSAIPSSFFRIRAVLPALNGDTSSVTEELYDEFLDFSTSISDTAVTGEPCRSLLILTSILWPGLVYPIVATSERLSPHFPDPSEIQTFEPFGQLFQEIKRIIALGQPFPPALLQGNSGLKDWEAQLLEVESSAQNWLNNNQTRNFGGFRPANRLWNNHLLANNGALSTVCSRIIKRDRNRITELRDFITTWEEPATEIDRHDIQVRGDRSTKLRPYTPFVKNHMRSYVLDLHKIAKSCIKLWANPPATDNDRLTREANSCRKSLQPLLESCRQRITEIVNNLGNPVELRAVCLMLSEEIERLLKVFQGEAASIAIEEDVRFAKQHELLLLDDFPLDADWEPQGRKYGKDFLRRLQGLLAPGKPLEHLDEVLRLGMPPDRPLQKKLAIPWRRVLEQRWDENHFAEADKIMEVMERCHFAGLEDLARTHRSRLDHARKKLEQERDIVQKNLEKAKMKGLIEIEDDRLGLQQRIDAIRPEDTFDIATALDELKNIDLEINELKKKPIEDFRLEMEQSGILGNPAWKDRMMALFEQEDLATAFEYLRIFTENREKGNAEIPDNIEMPAGCDFYPDFFDRIEPYFFGCDFNVPDFLQALEDRSSLGDLNIGGFPVSSEDAGRAREAMEKWIGLQREELAIAEQKNLVQGVLEFFSFVIKDIKFDSSSNLFRVTTPLMDSRKICPLPDYGSDCMGRYNILLLAEWPPHAQTLFENHLVQKNEVHVIIFHPQPLTRQQRQELADEYEKNYPRLRVLVLDTILLLYCMLHPKRSRLSLFNGAGMFAMAEPYRTVAGSVPIEMFFGRNDEAEELFSKEGSCLLYGGRQLGKTALLKEVKRRYDAREKDRLNNGVIVEYIDIKADLFGKGRPMQDIWNVIATKLPDYLLNNQVSRYDKGFSDGINRWLNQKKENRILLLLDETDDFLTNDRENTVFSQEGRWPYLTAFKNLMESTDRRFKVVFAGLHNVQRTAKDSNSPIHHLGKAICVGPFLGLKEIADANDMVRIPFLAMGFRFETPDIIGKILARSNYYPSLIQIFCSELLEYLKERIASEQDSCPPYLIRSEDIEAVAALETVQADIRSRFSMTLDLDNRFRIIALSMAYHSFEQRDKGFTVEEIMRMALSYWQTGFTDTKTTFSFRHLLLEMVELGVLREEQCSEDQRSRFTLRSPNVQRLLGGSEEMEEALVHAASEEATPTPSNADFRRIVNDQEPWWRSPLNQNQEGVVLGTLQHNVVVISGNEASGIYEVSRVIENMETPGALSVELHDLSELTQRHEFEPELKRVLQTKKAALTVLLIKASAPWTMEWIQHSRRLLGFRKSSKDRVKVVFLADPVKIWEFASQPDWQKGAITEWINLETWNEVMVRNWMRYLEYGVDNKDERGKVWRTTGYWWRFLTDLGEAVQQQPELWSRELQRQVEIPAGEKLKRFNLRPGMETVFEVMADYADPMAVSELLEIVHDVDTDFGESFVLKTLQWGRITSIVQNHYPDKMEATVVDNVERYQLDPFFARLLKTRKEEADGD